MLFQSVKPHSVLQSFHSKKTQQFKKIGAIFFLLFVPHLHTVSTLRSSGLLHPQYRFISLHCIPAVLCLPPFIFSAVAPSPSHRGWLRSVKTSLCPKSSWTIIIHIINFTGYSIVRYERGEGIRSVVMGGSN
jgi:hypothetical protein